MSHCSAASFVAGDEGLNFDELFGFTNPSEANEHELLHSSDKLPAVPRLASPFTGPDKDAQGHPVGWLSPSAASPASCIGTFDFEDFITLNESHDDLPVVEEQPPVATKTPSIRPKQTTAVAEQIDKGPAATDLETAQAEIAQLKAALAAKSPQHGLSTAPAGRLTTSSPYKWKFIDVETSPPKRQASMQMGPIEAMWSPSVTEDERRAFREQLASLTAPSPPQGHLNFSPQTAVSYISSQKDVEISPEDLLSMQQFLRANTDLIHSTSQQVSTSTTASKIEMAQQLGNIKAKCTALKHTSREASKSTTNNATKITKKTKATPKKAQNKRATSTSAITTTSPGAISGHRSIEEILALNFYSLNDQEKCRVLLPMLRGLDPKELEASLAELPCIQAKGFNHHVHVSRAIFSSPPTPEADYELAVKLTTGIPPSPTPLIKASHPPSAAPQASSSLQEAVTDVEVIEDHGAIRQREALEKAALLQAQGKKR